MTFDPNKHLTKLSGKDYLEVKFRLVWFRDEYPNGTIETEHIELTDQRAVFRATVTAFDKDRVLLGQATGYGSETPKDFKDFIEKAETKAVGRALAALGYGTQFAPELDEGSRIVDSPVQRTQSPRNAPTPPNVSTDTPAPTDADTARSMKRVHAVAAKHGITHEQLRQIAAAKAKANSGVNLSSLSDAAAWLLDEVADGIEADPPKVKNWLAKQAELMPTPDEVKNPDRFTA